MKTEIPDSDLVVTDLAPMDEEPIMLDSPTRVNTSWGGEHAHVFALTDTCMK